MMKKYVQLATPTFPAFLLSFLLLFTTACSTSTLTVVGSNGNNTPTPANTGTTTTPVVQTVQMPQTDISCPANNTARAAVMRPLARGSHQNLVYIYNEVPKNTSTAYGHLRRYDTTTGQAINIVDSGLHVNQAQVSADGQWVLFLSVPDPRGDALHSTMLQLVRMDGQGLQTLYCFPASNMNGSSAIHFQWSVDAKSIAVTVETEDPSATFTTSQIFLLDVASGTTRQLFLDQKDPGYWYMVMSWLDNSHFYVTRGGSQPGVEVAPMLYLVDASTTTVAHPGSLNILSIPVPPQGGQLSMDSSYDGTKLFIATCAVISAGTTGGFIAVEPATGGKSQTISTNETNTCVLTLRAIAADTLLLLVQIGGTNSISYQVWTMHTDGSGKHVLNTIAGPGIDELNATSQFPWSNVSRNGSSYALQQGPAANRQSILIGALNGGDPTTAVTADNQLSGLDLAGWTTL